MDTDKSAGVVLYMENAQLIRGAEAYVGQAKVSATVSDIDLWESIVSQMNEGIPLHKGKDFKSELIDVLQDEKEKILEDTGRERQSLVTENEQLRQQANLHGGVVAEKDQQIGLLEAQRATEHAAHEREVAILKDTINLLQGAG